jgi:BirA family transcriptional regulator, biotin operon repressor / biotin---[acetyl-CoA-carboxylase] ligase
MIIGSKVYFYDRLTSTNSEAVRLLKEAGLQEGAVISAAYQSAGRGQKDKNWESEINKNLLISIILFPVNIGPDLQFLISMAISLGICDFLRRHLPDSTIKWPNDIYVNSDKIAGVLIENSILGSSIEYSIAGIGLNINQDKFFGNAPNPVSLKMITGIEYNIQSCLKQLTFDLDKRYKQLLSENWSQIRTDFTSQLYRIGMWHKYSDSDGIFTGRIEAVSDDGTLTISRRNGLVKSYGFKDVVFIP